MATWPTTLPDPDGSTYSFEPDDPNARTEMDAGRDRVRRKWTDVPVRNPIAWTFDDTQFQIFQDFWKTDLLDGSEIFDLPVFTSGAYVTKQCRFVGPWQSRYEAWNRWNVSGTIEVLDFF